MKFIFLSIVGAALPLYSQAEVEIKQPESAVIMANPAPADHRLQKGEEPAVRLSKAERLYTLAKSQRMAGNFPEAFKLASSALRINKAEAGVLAENGAFDYRLLQEYAIAANATGHYPEFLIAANLLLSDKSLPQNVRREIEEKVEQIRKGSASSAGLPNETMAFGAFAHPDINYHSEAKPKDAESVVNLYLAQSYQQMGVLDAALEYYEKAVKLTGDEPDVYFSLLQIALLKEALKKAPEDVIKSYLTAYDLNPERIDSLYLLAQYQRKLKNYETAFTAISYAMVLPKPSNISSSSKWVYDYGLLLEYSLAAFNTEHYLEALLASNLALNKTLPQDARDVINGNQNLIKAKMQALGDREVQDLPKIKIVSGSQVPPKESIMADLYPSKKQKQILADSNIADGSKPSSKITSQQRPELAQNTNPIKERGKKPSSIFDPSSRISQSSTPFGNRTSDNQKQDGHPISFPNAPISKENISGDLVNESIDSSLEAAEIQALASNFQFEEDDDAISEETTDEYSPFSTLPCIIGKGYTTGTVGRGLGHVGSYQTLGLFLGTGYCLPCFLFTDLRAHYFGTERWGSNIGMGSRHYDQETESIYGFNAFYDFRQSHGDFHQLGLGVEFFGQCLDCFANCYYPVGSKRHKLERHGKRHRKYMDALRGGDIEIGTSWNKWCSKSPIDLYVGVGAYHYCEREDSVKSFTGGRVRVDFDYYDLITIGLSATFDRVYHNTVQGYVTLNIPFDECGIALFRSYDDSDCFSDMLVRPVQRYPVIVNTPPHRK